MAIAIGRLIPDLGNQGVDWPYTAVGGGFALYGVALILYGTVRVREVEAALRRGGYAHPSDRFLVAITLVGALLGVAAFVLILVD